MSAGWEVGDLALCVAPSEGVWIDDDGQECDGGPQPDGIYRVAGIEINVSEYQLAFEGFAEDDFYCAQYFRKIKPDTEPCEAEFTTLIKRGRKVGA